MENTLNRLLAAETQAETLVAAAVREREQLIQQTLSEVQQQEQQFIAKIPDLQASFLQKSEAHAQQSIAELTKRYAERKTVLQELAHDNQQQALTAALTVLLSVGKEEIAS